MDPLLLVENFSSDLDEKVWARAYGEKKRVWILWWSKLKKNFGICGVSKVCEQRMRTYDISIRHSCASLKLGILTLMDKIKAVVTEIFEFEFRAE